MTQNPVRMIKDCLYSMFGVGKVHLESVHEDPRQQHGYGNELYVLEAEAIETVNMTEKGTLNEEDEFFEDAFEVALDSGAGDHCADEKDAPAYKITASAGSRAGQHFVSASNDRIANKGEFTLALKTGHEGEGRGREIRSTFQVARVTRPLWSVGKICDEGFDVKFSKDYTVVLTKQGKEICRFERRGGLYLAKLSLRNPMFKKGFRRQGPKP